MAQIEITDFRNIRLLNSGKLRAFVDVVFANSLVVKGFKVIEGSNGLFVAAPARKVEGKNGEKDSYNDIVYFTKDSNAWSGVQDQILAHYKQSVASSNSGGDDI